MFKGKEKEREKKKEERKGKEEKEKYYEKERERKTGKTFKFSWNSAMLVRLLGKTGFVEKESLLKRGINSTKKDRSNARDSRLKKFEMKNRR